MDSELGDWVRVAPLAGTVVVMAPALLVGGALVGITDKAGLTSREAPGIEIVPPGSVPDPGERRCRDSSNSRLSRSPVMVRCSRGRRFMAAPGNPLRQVI